MSVLFMGAILLRSFVVLLLGLPCFPAFARFHDQPLPKSQFSGGALLVYKECLRPEHRRGHASGLFCFHTSFEDHGKRMIITNSRQCQPYRLLAARSSNWAIFRPSRSRTN